MTSRDQADRRLSYGLIAALLTACFFVGLARQVRAQDPTTGSLAKASDAVTISLVGIASETIQLTGAWSGTVVFEATVDNGTNWQAVPVANVSTGAPMLQANTNGLQVIQNAGFTAVRARAATWGSGTATVTFTRGFLGFIAPPCNALLRAAGACK